jgi:hypothetical protein
LGGKHLSHLDRRFDRQRRNTFEQRTAAATRERVIRVSALQAALVPKNIQPEEAEMKYKSN